MNVRAKFFVQKLERASWNPEALTVTMQPVSRGEENKEWAAATPSGELRMTILNAPAAAVFDAGLGDEFYIDISPVPPE